MSVDEALETFAIDLFSALGPLKIKRMFGGAIVYQGELGFALLDDGTIWIKVDDGVEALFADQGCDRFTYPTKDGRRLELSYRRLPQDALDDPEAACRWATLGLEAALRKGAFKARSKRNTRL